MSDLDELANVVRNRRPVQYARPAVVQQEPGHGHFYHLTGGVLFLWTALCLAAAGWVVYAAVFDERAPTIAELGVGYGLGSDTRVQVVSEYQMEHIRRQRMIGAAELCGGIALGWAVLATPMALVMIASKR